MIAERIIEVAFSNSITASVVAVFAIVATRVCSNPKVSHTLWLVVLVKLITPPIVDLQIGSFGSQPIAAPGNESQVPKDSHATSVDTLRVSRQFTPSEMQKMGNLELPVPGIQKWTTLVASIWGLVSMICLVISAKRIRSLRQLVSRTAPAPEGLHAEVKLLSERLGLRRTPNTRVHAAQLAPFVCFTDKGAELVLPSRLMSQLSGPERRTVLVHELAHVCRNDHWVRRLELIVACLCWWNPIAWHARRQLNHTAELCCDVIVADTFPGCAHVYAEALLKTVGFVENGRAILPFGVSAFGESHLLGRRMEMICRQQWTTAMPWRIRLFLLLVGICILPLSFYAGTASVNGEESDAVKTASPAVDGGNDGASLVATRDGVRNEGPGSASLGRVVERFNESANGRYIGGVGIPLTTEEVLTSVQEVAAQEFNAPKASQEMRDMARRRLRDVVISKRLPMGASLRINRVTRHGVDVRTVWLDVPIESSLYYGVSIRNAEFEDGGMTDIIRELDKLARASADLGMAVEKTQTLRHFASSVRASENLGNKAQLIQRLKKAATHMEDSKRDMRSLLEDLRVLDAISSDIATTGTPGG